jgi:hypothetical protein
VWFCGSKNMAYEKVRRISPFFYNFTFLWIFSPALSCSSEIKVNKSSNEILQHWEKLLRKMYLYCDSEWDTQDGYVHNLAELESCRKGQCHSRVLEYCKVMIKRMISHAKKLSVTYQGHPSISQTHVLYLIPRPEM